MVVFDLLIGRRHEVDQFADAFLDLESGDENSRVPEVELFGGVVATGGADLEVSAALSVEQRAGDARGVEPGAAEP